MVKLSLLGDPVGRRLLGESARPSTVAAAYRALLSGDTDAFALVATWVLAGRALPAVSAADSFCRLARSRKRPPPCAPKAG